VNNAGCMHATIECDVQKYRSKLTFAVPVASSLAVCGINVLLVSVLVRVTIRARCPFLTVCA
jgi:hypothetical protein